MNSYSSKLSTYQSNSPLSKLKVENAVENSLEYFNAFIQETKV